MARSQRDKGARGEREVVHAARGAGMHARRTAELQAAVLPEAQFADVLIVEYPLLWVEVKRDERMSVDAMVRQAEADAGHVPHSTPVVAYRRNRQPWRAVVPLDFLLSLLSERTCPDE